MEEDWEIPAVYEREMWGMTEQREMNHQPLADDGGGEDWDTELLVPAQGRLVYVGQGQSQYTFFHQSSPGLQYPKKKKRKRNKKKKSASTLIQRKVLV